MISCLFRMIDLQCGLVTVDGLDIATIPREVVRTRLVGVPQDAFVIDASSVRLNADPTEKLTDAVIEDALNVVELWNIVVGKGGLDARIEHLHLSHGQRQLFCIARAMLRPSPIVILDEATSRYVALGLTYLVFFPQLVTLCISVDSHTDKLIQRVMRERFSNHTVLAIVHKLDSVLEDFDQVIVLDAGELREFGPPRELLQKGPEVSAFAALYESLEVKHEDFDKTSGEGQAAEEVAEGRANSTMERNTISDG